MPLPPLLSSVEAHAARSTDSSIVYLDVRTPDEFAAGHPPAAINVPFLFMSPATGRVPNPDFISACKLVVPQNVPILVGCASGNRSAHAIALMRTEGWSQLTNLVGGFQGGPGVPGWSQCNLPIARDGVTWASVRSKIGL